MSDSRTNQDASMKINRLRAALRALAAASLAAGMGSALAQAHYYDGKQARRVTLQPDLRAEFSRGDPRRTTLSAPAGAMALEGVGDSLVRIVRMAPGSERLAGPSAAGAAVYREGDSPAGRLMALPGGVMVKFKPDWSRARIEAWLAGRGLAIERQLAMQGSWFLIATPAGQASLDTANAIFETGEVLAASPNWWKQTVTR